MRRKLLSAWSKRRLRTVLLLVLICLLIPTAILVSYTLSQLKWESFHQQRTLAEELVERIDRQLDKSIKQEDARSFTDYAFLNVAKLRGSNYIKRSPLSKLPIQSEIPGVIGYFQIDEKGLFSTPAFPGADIEPAVHGLSSGDLKQRLAFKKQLLNVLQKNKIVSKVATRPLEEKVIVARQEPAKRSPAPAIESAPSAPVSSQATAQKPAVAPRQKADTIQQEQFDQWVQQKKQQKASGQSSQLGLGKLEDIKLKKLYARKQAEEAERRRKQASKRAYFSDRKASRKERTVVLAKKNKLKAGTEVLDSVGGKGDLKVSIFESEIDALEFNMLDSGHLVFFRKVWRGGKRIIQGFLVEQEAFIKGFIGSMYYTTGLSQSARLAIAYNGNVIKAFSASDGRKYLASARELDGALLLQSPLSSLGGNLELVFSVRQLPMGPGANIVAWMSLMIAVVFIGGFYLIYRLGLKQILLSRQQQDFISAVSHELKTPLTSIRMYAEMLREGWSKNDDQKQDYYAYIYDESERLGRLINNVLQLARMTRNDLEVELKPYAVSQIIDVVRSKIASQVEQAGFVLEIQVDESVRQQVITVDIDYLVQIVINLVDNAIKFSKKAEKKQIDINFTPLQDKRLGMAIRDYGPGIDKKQLGKIFKLFYRSENELTRETVGTGIGLALVQQLTALMHGSIDVVNRDTGVEFIVFFNTAGENNNN